MDMSASHRAQQTRPASAAGCLTYSIDDVAGMLGISRSTAYECVRRGEIPAHRFGRRVVVLRKELEALLAQPVPSALDEL